MSVRPGPGLDRLERSAGFHDDVWIRLARPLMLDCGQER
jgi:hypothetical protein